MIETRLLKAVTTMRLMIFMMLRAQLLLAGSPIKPNQNTKQIQYGKQMQILIQKKYKCKFKYKSKCKDDDNVES